VAEPYIRNMELVRFLLMYIAENSSDGWHNPQPSLKNFSQELVSYHFGLMHERGLFHGVKYDNGTWGFEKLTWEGQDLLPAMQDETVWSKAKERAGSTFGALTLDVLKELLKQVMRQHVGLG
jgi:hypothetical protein